MLNLFKNLFGGTNTEEIKEVIANGGVIIDVRSAGEFAGGHAKGAKNIPLDQLQSNIAKIKAFKKPIVVCCASGMRSARAKSILANQGIEQVYDAGGWANLR
ncbi:MAG: rhodanese-like domain-containing protein [Spirosomataceae bacterium]